MMALVPREILEMVEATTIRTSGLTSYPACPRRWFANTCPGEIREAGFELRDEFADGHRRDEMLGAVFFGGAIRRARRYCPNIAKGIEAATADAAAQENLSAEVADLAREGFPNHAGAEAGIAESVDERFDDLRAVFRVSFR